MPTLTYDHSLTLTANVTGFSVAGGTTSKTLIVSEDATIDQDIQKSAAPSFAGLTLTDDVNTDRWLSRNDNTFFGVDVVGGDSLAHGAGSTGYFNTAFGHESLYSGTEAVHNVAIGGSSAYSLTTGARNVFLGFEAGYFNVVGNDNAAFGYRAGKGTSGESYNNCVFAGTQAGLVNYGDDNFGMGKFALWANTTGIKNVAIGSDAASFTQTGNRNVCIGEGAGKGASGQSFSNNTFLGVRTGYNCTTGAQNVSVGTYAGQFESSGQQNTKVGYAAGYGASAQVHNNNTFIGRQSGFAVTTGSNNTTLGHSAGEDITSGAGNVCLGYMAGEGNLTTDDNELWIANSDTATPLIYGEFDTAFIKINNHIYMLERSADPTEPAEGECVIWMSDGTGKGDDGDVMIASQAGGTTNYGTLFDHSGGAGW